MGYTPTLTHFNRYPQLLTVLLNIRHHMEVEKYDYPVIVCGDTGNGKSMLALHILELWYRVVIRKEFNSESIRYIRSSRISWIKNFKELEPLDINCNDEGADGLLNKEAITKFGRDIQKLYNVFRKKLFFTMILIPDFFDLPLYFRKRIRGVIWVNKRGQFKYYTKKGIKFLNGLNETRYVKNMEVAYPFFTGVFPDYQGVLRKPYDDMAFEATDNILDEMIQDEDNKKSSVEIYLDDVKDRIVRGMGRNEICKDLQISPATVTKIRNKLKMSGDI